MGLRPSRAAIGTRWGARLCGLAWAFRSALAWVQLLQARRLGRTPCLTWPLFSCRQFESLARKLIAARTKGGHHGGLLSRGPFRCFSAMSKHLPDPKQVRQLAVSGVACRDRPCSAMSKHLTDPKQVRMCRFWLLALLRVPQHTSA